MIVKNWHNKEIVKGLKKFKPKSRGKFEGSKYMFIEMQNNDPLGQGMYHILYIFFYSSLHVLSVSMGS